MKTVSVCVGSSCHLKGAYNIIRLFEETIEEQRLREKIVLKGTFCLGKCSEEGVTVDVGGKMVTGVTQDNFRNIFNEFVRQSSQEG
ncbi:MAG TPA: (2Fe-2S) ferredoxin domain-containing protein [Atribacteraceae bacterium]|nr:(2Fe-2S) ferredoxin domain-containing protein [Atribacteraceae bacterium]